MKKKTIEKEVAKYIKKHTWENVQIESVVDPIDGLVIGGRGAIFNQDDSVFNKASFSFSSERMIFSNSKNEAFETNSNEALHIIKMIRKYNRKHWGE